MTTYRKGWPAIHNHYIPSVARRIQATITTAEQNIETLIKTETNDYETIENIHESIRQIDPQHLPIILNMLLIYKYTDTLNVVQKQRLQSLIQYVRGKQNAAIEKQANAILTQKINGIINTAVKSTLDTLKNNISKFIMSDIKNATQRITRLIQSSKCLITQGSSYVNLMTSIMETINGLTVPPLVQTQQENIQLQSIVIEKMFSQTRALTNMQKNAILDLIARNCLTQPTTPENVKLQTVVVNQIISEIDDLETVQRNAILDLIARNCLTQPATPENVKLQTVVVNQIISRTDDLETVQRNEILDFIITNFLAHPTTLKNVELQPSIVTEILSQAPSLTQNNIPMFCVL